MWLDSIFSRLTSTATLSECCVLPVFNHFSTTPQFSDVYILIYDTKDGIERLKTVHTYVKGIQFQTPWKIMILKNNLDVCVKYKENETGKSISNFMVIVQRGY